jgi:hypothetical protein
VGLSTKASPPNPKKSNDDVVHRNGVVKEKCSGGSSFKDGVQRNGQFCVKMDGISGEVMRSGVDVCCQLYENAVVSRIKSQ